ncbi:hypothetical protein ACQ4PT_005461 [Festuca glaucescens]
MSNVHMDCEVFNHGVEYGHGPSQGNTYTVTEPDDDEYYRNDLCSETELSQEFLVNEIRKIVLQSVERRELHKSIRKQGRKEKRRKLLQNGGEDDIDPAPRATSRYCLSYMFEWLADVCTFDDDDIIVIQSTVIMNPGSVKDTFAIPCGELPIATEDEDGKLAFLAQFALTDVPPIKYFGRMAMSDDLPDDVFKRCFMAVTLGSFLCPTSSTKPSTKYLGALVDVDNIKFLNWCKLVHDWLVCCIKKYKKDKMKVRYLDFVEFGSIMLPATLPRISVWKGDLIKHFSNMVIARTGSYNLYHTVPCFVRKQFNNLVGNIFYVAAPDEVQYKFNVKKGDSKTRRIPKEVLRSLNVEETGLASFYVNDYGYHPKGAYYTTTDGRMKFESCWAEFVKEYDMEAGNIILILFHMGGTGVINISVDRI